MSTPFELLAFVAGHYGVLAVLLAAAWSVGRRLTERLGYRDGLDAAGVACALGLGVWSAALTLLALLGALRPLPVLALMAISQ